MQQNKLKERKKSDKSDRDPSLVATLQGEEDTDEAGEKIQPEKKLFRRSTSQLQDSDVSYSRTSLIHTFGWQKDGLLIYEGV